MKKLFIAVLAATWALPAMAGDVYLGGSVGRSALTVDNYGTSLSGNGTSVTLALGYQFNRSFGAEVGSAHFGKFDMQGGGVRVSFDRSAALYAALAGAWPVADNLSVYAKAGIVRTETDFAFGGVSDGTDSHLSPLLGVGAGYALTPKATAFAEYLDFGKIVDRSGITVKAATLGAGIRYAF